MYHVDRKGKRIVTIGFGFTCWYCSSCENRFLIGLISGLGLVQSSPHRNVEDAKGSSLVCYQFLNRVLPLLFILPDWGFPLVWFVQGVWVLPQCF